MGIIQKVLAVGEGKKIKALEAIVPQVNAFEDELIKLSDDELRAKIAEFKQRRS